MKGNSNLREPKKKRLVTSSFYELVNKKIFLILFCMVLLFLIVVGKLFYINMIDGQELTKKALNQLTSTKFVQADRGLIYDRNGKELVTNITRANIYYNGQFEKGKLEQDLDYKNRRYLQIQKDAELLASVLGKSKDELLESMLKKETGTLKIATEITRDIVKKVENLKIYRVSIEDLSRRFYPYGDRASHIVGFTNSDGIGQYGLESKYDEELSGIEGKNISIRNIHHKKIPMTDEQNYAPKEGQNIMSSIDLTIQQIAEDVAEKARREHGAEMVSIIVQDTMNGQILAMANNPSYDLNNIKLPVTDEQKLIWDKLSSDEKSQYWYKNWGNFCVNSQYEPGSTFKLITAASALEEATTSPDKQYNCEGVLFDKIRCTSKNRGSKTMEQALVESCNISFVKIGSELGSDIFMKYIKAFGFGEKTGIDLPAEINGEIPPNVNEIGKVKLATLSYGHGIAVTPIQLINAVSAIANGGILNVPRVVDRFEDENGNTTKKIETKVKRRVISEKTSDTMRKLMESVVDRGTGKLAKVPGYRVGGKTGTANIASSSKRGYDEEYMSSFIGIAPINDPKITVLVLIQKPEGNFYAAKVAAPSAGEVIRKTLEYLNIPKTEKTNKKGFDDLVMIPDVKGMLVSDAGKKLIRTGLKFNLKSEDLSDVSTVIGQYPNYGKYVNQGTIVDLTINNNENSEKIMPNLIDKDYDEILSILDDMGIDYQIDGVGTVVSQSIPAGGKINSDRTIKIKMSQPKEEIEEIENSNQNKKN